MKLMLGSTLLSANQVLKSGTTQGCFKTHQSQKQLKKLSKASNLSQQIHGKQTNSTPHCQELFSFLTGYINLINAILVLTATKCNRCQVGLQGSGKKFCIVLPSSYTLHKQRSINIDQMSPILLSFKRHLTAFKSTGNCYRKVL